MADIIDKKHKMADEKETSYPTETDTFISEKDPEQNKNPLDVTYDESSKVSKIPTQEQFSRCAIYFLGLLSVGLLVCLLGMTVVWKLARDSGLEETEHEFCLNCTQLFDDTSMNKEMENIRKSSDGIRCCGKTSDMLKQLVDKASKDKYVNDLSRNFYISSSDECRGKDQVQETPSGKVAGIDFQEETHPPEPYNRIRWNSTGPESFLKAKVNYDDGHLEVKQSGIYYVFSQLKWNIYGTDHSVDHRVYVYSAYTGMYDILLESRKSKCDGLEESGETSSSVGAIFELKKRDKIFVTTSKPKLLSPSYQGNYFGLYLVTDKLQ